MRTTAAPPASGHSRTRPATAAKAAPAARRGPPGTSAIAKTLELMDLVALAPRPPSFTQLMQSSGLPRATLHRLLGVLVDHGMLQATPERCYTPGMHLLELSRHTWENLDVRQAAAPAIAELGRRTGETVHLAMLSDDAVVYIDKVECDYPLRLHSSIGKRGPVHCTAVGKAMAACLPPAEQRALAARLELKRHTPHTLASQRALLAELARIRDEGLAFDREEHVIGIHCVAAAILDFRGRCVGGISLTAPTARVDAARLAEYGAWVRAAADDAARRLGGSAPRPGTVPAS